MTRSSTSDDPFQRLRKVYFEGTHRVRHPVETLDIVGPLLNGYGITRLADVTGLDVLGIRVVMSIRPLAMTLTVSQGKGLDLTAAKVSAAMESIELAHAERLVPRPVHRQVAGRDLGLDYHVGDLHQHFGSLLTEHVTLDWVPARKVVTGAETLVPRSAVHMGRWLHREWRPFLLAASSNGLASGNTRAEATVHALYEVIERDCTARLSRLPVGARCLLDIDSIDDPHCQALIGRIRGAGAVIEVVVNPSRWPVPCFTSYLWASDMRGTVAAGSGAHSDPSVALSRAITEAAQSRMTVIVGTRDDIRPRAFRQLDGAWPAPEARRPSTTWADVTARFDASFQDDVAEAHWLAQQVHAGTGTEPMLVDLSTRSEFSVVKVLCAGLEFRGRHEIPRT